MIIKNMISRPLTAQESALADKMAYYTNGKNAFVQIDASVFILVPVNGDMQEAARQRMEEICTTPPDFSSYVMDDDCPLVLMQDTVFAVSTEPLEADAEEVPMMLALTMRETIRTACERQEILALYLPE